MIRNFFIILFFISLSVNGQDEIQYGLKINAGWKLNTHRNKATTLRSAENGYGFSIGVPLRFWQSELSSIDTGLEYEYAAFDSYAFNTLQTSFRIQSIGIPVLYNVNLYKNWYWQAGGGINYNAAVNFWAAGYAASAKKDANLIQPYVMGGITSLAERNDHFFEFGLQARYFVLDLWKKNTSTYQSATSKLLILDFVLKFYI